MECRWWNVFVMIGALLATLNAAAAAVPDGQCGWTLSLETLEAPMESQIQVHRDDIDPYGHVNSTVYLNYILSSRWCAGESTPDITDSCRLSGATMKFIRPISGPGQVRVRSGVKGEADNQLEYEIRNDDLSVIHSSGTLEFAPKKSTEPASVAAPAATPWGLPINYKRDIEVRFNDLLPGGFVSPSMYLDYIISTRWLYLKNEFNENAESWLKKGLAFFLSKAEMRFHQSLRGHDRLTVESWVSDMPRDEKQLEVSYQILFNGNEVASSGKLYFAVMDITNPTQPKLQAFPEWARPYFFGAQP